MQQQVIFGPASPFGEFSYLNLTPFPSAQQLPVFQPQLSINGVSRFSSEPIIAQQLGSEFDQQQGSVLGQLYALTHNLLQTSAQLSQLTVTEPPLLTSANSLTPRFNTVYSERSVADSNPSVLTASVTDNATLSTYNVQVTNPGTPTATYAVNSGVPVALIGNTFTLDSGSLLVTVNTPATGSATLSVSPNLPAIATAIHSFVGAYNAQLDYLNQNAAALTPDIKDNLLAAVKPQLSALGSLGISVATGGHLQINDTQLASSLNSTSLGTVESVFGGLQGVATATGQQASQILATPPSEYSAVPASFVVRSSVFNFLTSRAPLQNSLLINFLA